MIVEEKKIENIGKINIADDVVASIAGIAAIEVDGVARLTGGISKEVVSKLGKKKLAKGVEVTIVDGNVEADVSVELEYGNNITKVSKEVQTKVKQSIENMTGLNVTIVNVVVSGIKLD
ncbi:MAG: Asp23/Gls24 family envelope stress response protein [Lachnospiraceae bacterium]|nr:Asp23/Gls24 family envelope stress response protein [Lachnospiraceae bacterium]